MEDVFPDILSTTATIRTLEALRPLVSHPEGTDSLLEMEYSRKRKFEASDHHSDGEEVAVKKVRAEDPSPLDLTYTKYDLISPQYCEKLTFHTIFDLACIAAPCGLCATIQALARPNMKITQTQHKSRMRWKEPKKHATLAVRAICHQRQIFQY